MKKLLLYLTFVLSSYGYALVAGPVKIQGIVVSYDKDTVTLKQKNVKIKVPRESIPKKFKLNTGKRVYALLKPEELNKILDIDKKKKKK